MPSPAPFVMLTICDAIAPAACGCQNGIAFAVFEFHATYA
jgi:hypothetical protein